MRVVSFTTDINSTIMWANYSRHTGFCIEYPVSDLDDFTIFNLHKVFYNGKFKPNFLKLYYKPIEELTINWPILAATNKDPDWSFEKEWRIIRPPFNLDDLKGIQLSMPCPSGIYLSTNIESKNQQKIFEIIDDLEKIHNKKIYIYKMIDVGDKLEPVIFER